ncbi:hypothetical protein LINPERPRIM_LOCUS20890, partial [Linum perenne]
RAGGILKLPSSVWEKGYERLKAALVAQFVGTPPPLRVIAAVANRLWGYEGLVTVSKYLDTCFLFEFNSVSLCDWVLSRSWHIHNSGMLLRRWEKGIKPLDLSKKSTPEWITIKNVPPAAISIEGISWLTSLMGKPWKNFVREGLDVKVCVLRDVAIPCPESIEIETENGEPWRMEVVRATARDYKGSRKVWAQVAPKETAVGAATALLPDLRVVVNDVANTSLEQIVNDVVGNDAVVNEAVLLQATPLVEAADKQVVNIESGKSANSKTIKRRLNRKKKKSAKKALSDSLSAVVDDIDNDGRTSTEGGCEDEINEEENVIDSLVAVEEGHGEVAIVNTDIHEEQARDETNSSNLNKNTQNESESVEGAVRAWTADDERDYKEGKTASKMQKSVERASQGRGVPQSFVQRVSGVKKRHKNKYR